MVHKFISCSYITFSWLTEYQDLETTKITRLASTNQVTIGAIRKQQNKKRRMKTQQDLQSDLSFTLNRRICIT